MNNPKGAMAHGSIRQLFAQPKLTDEQRKEIESKIRYVENNKYDADYIKDLKLVLASEQTWREQAEQLLHNQRIERDLLNAAHCKADEYLYRYERAQVQLNQALDVLVDVRKLAAEFVSSLSEQEERP